MKDSFVWLALCAPVPIRLLALCALISVWSVLLTHPCSPPFCLHTVSTSVLCPCDTPPNPVITEQRTVSTFVHYTRDELLQLRPSLARLTPVLTTRLRTLNLGVGLPRKRYPKQKNKALSVLLFNCRSCRQITTDIHDLILESKADITMLTETWLYDHGDEVFIRDMTPSGYTLHSFPRSGSRGGGIAFVIKDNLSSVVLFRPLDFKSFEGVEMKLSTKRVSTVFICLYRPPPSKQNKLQNSDFIREFPDLLSCHAKCDVSIFGDFNFHYNDQSDSQVKCLMTMLSDHGFKQLVDVPTHRSGHTLDWVVVRDTHSLVSFRDVREYPNLSDHSAVSCRLAVACPPPPLRCVTSRNLRAVDPAAFQKDVEEFAADACSSAGSNPDAEGLVDTYTTGLRRVLERHAPLVTRTVRDRPSAPWLTDEVREARRERRRAERCWRKTGLTVHREIYASKRKSTSACVSAAKQKHYSDKVDSAASSSKQFFNVCNDLMGKSTAKPLPSNIKPEDLPQRFSDFFSDKIRLLRQNLDSRSSKLPEYAIYDGPKLSCFSNVTENNVRDLLSGLPNKCSVLDPIPTSFVKQSADSLVPCITSIINASLTSGYVPKQFKAAVVTPILKKAGLDVNTLKNYRPVSNLPFLSKLLEKIILKQLLNHLTANNLLEPNQSAYRQGHSTETAVLCVLNDLLSNTDEKCVSLVALLDLSAAFDTIDHNILLKRLELTFGLCDTTLSWFKSYLTNRFQSVSVHGVVSQPHLLKYGVPQGSVLGPVLFVLYSQPLSDTIVKNDCSFQKFADDTEVSKSGPLNNFRDSQLSVQTCISDLHSWMDSNKLFMNADKTELMPVGTSSCLKQLNTRSVPIMGESITLKSSVKYLGVTIDQTLSMHNHISDVCRKAFFHLRRIALVRPYLSDSAAARLVTAFVSSRLDYCNSVLAGLPADQINRLQRIQNCAARLVLKKNKREHITPLLFQLHWLPVQFRIQFKLAVFAYRFFENSLPSYLSASLTAYQPSRSLRSSSEKLLKIPKFCLKTVGHRSFSYSASSVWNSLPLALRNSLSLPQFKKDLKTYLFRQAFY